MAKIAKEFQFTTQLPIGAKQTTTVLITGQYYHDQCDRDGMNYDIEDVWGGHYGENGEFVKSDRLTILARVAEAYCERLWDNIDEATTSHIEYLTGYKSADMVLDMPEEMPDVFEAVKSIKFPNPDTYTAHSSILPGAVS